MLSNLTRASLPDLQASFAKHCSPTEQSLISKSSCYGKRCRFAVRALVMAQLEAARLPLRDRHRERSCLREGRACPEVMSLWFWAYHDGGEGVGKLSDHHHSTRDHPLYVDDRESSDVLAVYRVMLASTFCVHIGGDTPTRKSYIDAIMAQCIPVVFQRDRVLLDSLPFADAIPYEELSLFVPLMTELAAATGPSGLIVAPSLATGSSTGAARAEGSASLMQHLRAVPATVIASKQALLRKYAPLLQYSYPKLRAPTAAGGSGAPATGDNAVALAMQQLAADVTPL